MSFRAASTGSVAFAGAVDKPVNRPMVPPWLLWGSRQQLLGQVVISQCSLNRAQG